MDGFRVVERDAAANTSRIRLVVVRSLDGGDTFEREAKVADLKEVTIIPTLAADPGSAAFKDRVYVVWRDSIKGRPRILLSASADAGRSWSSPRFVDDSWPRADGTGPDVVMPVVRVNRNGVVGVSWYDKRDVPGNTGWDHRFAASLDGGETFTPSVRVSEKSSLSTGKELAWVVQSGEKQGTKEGVAVSYDPVSLGTPYRDTNGMAMGADGTFHPIWVDLRTGTSQIWTAAVQVQGVVARNGAPELSNSVDVSEKVAIDVSQVALDRRTGIMTGVYRVRNTSDDTLRGPLNLRLISLEGGVGAVSIRGADNSVSGVGAVWDFTPLIGDATLAPGELSKGRTLTLMLTDPQRFGPKGDERFDFAHLMFRVLAGAAEARTQ
jgi:hypothetical protein